MMDKSQVGRAGELAIELYALVTAGTMHIGPTLMTRIGESPHPPQWLVALSGR